jgi:NitT/TauT family transport system ATP-binding protein
MESPVSVAERLGSADLMASAARDVAMIEMRNLSMTFTRSDGTGVTAVDNVTASFREGEFTCVVGPSGHGKTTLLHLVAGLLRPERGDLVVNGKPVSGPGPDRGVVFQKDSVFPWMRVVDNVSYGPKCRGLDRSRCRKIALRYLHAVGLAHVAHSWPRELSGGMLKRVAVATAFANDAKVLLLDEPFGSLDYVTRRQLHRVLLRLWASTDGEAGRRRTVMFVTHDVDEALTLADRIIVVQHGQLVEDIRNTLPRPRSDDDLAQPEILRMKHVLLRYLELDQPGWGGERETED